MSVRQPSDPQPTDRSATLSHRLEDGVISLPDGRRVAAWPEIFLRTLHVELAAASVDSARHLLYRAGFEWGLQELLFLSQRLREESATPGNLDLWKLDPAVAFDRWSAPLATAGWGTWTIDRTAHATGLTVVELRHSVVVAALASSLTAPAVAEPMCHLYAGLFAGAVSFYDRREVHAVETACVALGHDACRFLVGPGHVIDRAEAARAVGATHAEILRAVLTPAAPTPPAPTAPAKAAKIPWKK